MNKKIYSLFALFFFSWISVAQDLGDFFQGGIIFYKDSAGHGLIIDTAYLEATFEWVPEEPLLSDWGVHWFNNPGTVEEFIGAGHFNTQNLAENNNSHYAGNLTSLSSNGGYSDWFLPSKEELFQVMLNVILIDSVIEVYGGDIIDSSFHWSSSQANTSSAWTFSPYSTNSNTGESSGPFEFAWSKSNSALVRAVRCIDNDCTFMGSPLFGCVDSLAENYNPSAGANDFSCEYIQGCADNSACNFDSLVTFNNLETCDYTCVGCTDSVAQNYLGGHITIEDGSCLYCIDDYQTISVSYDSLIDNSVFFQINNGAVAFGHVTDAGYNEGFCIPDGCYNLYMFADCNITENWVGNTIDIGDFSFTLNAVDASFDFSLGEGYCLGSNLFGCTDSSAFNFNPIALSDDGSCTYFIFGCTDPFACNWDSEATQEDGTCFYPIAIYLDCTGNCLSDSDQDGQCDEIDFDDGLGLVEQELLESNLISMVDIFGKVYKEHNNGSLLFYIYSNGKVVKRFRQISP